MIEVNIINPNNTTNEIISVIYIPKNRIKDIILEKYNKKYKEISTGVSRAVSPYSMYIDLKVFDIDEESFNKIYKLIGEIE